MVVGYGITLFISISLLALYFLLVRKKDLWLGLMFVSVPLVNLGYLLISVSKTVGFAIFANDVSYFGSILISVCMLFTVIKLCGFDITRTHIIICASLSIIMFLIVATSGILPWYYERVWIETVSGATKLVKEYGPLHPLYLLYILSYFVAMIITIIISIKKKKIASHKFSGLIVAVVCGNILVWLFEKFINWEFEFLSVTYISSEIILLLLYWMMQDYVRLDLIDESGKRSSSPIDIATMPIEEKILKILSYLPSGEVLALREREILELVLKNKKRRDIADELCLSENTIKTYTRTLYSKLGVSSREELYSLLTK